ncbi:ferritin-like domain-containing protein [Myxosarcina sp. GI1]|uniref:ferritin-like domain-containing protein n=1 Tax=Myxosarcina sp. GI1 TaxID=1541065 RepID=UPI00055F19DD|nr:ferritin-like domain-containing protein [Myxosarcina sp. GI1]
MNFVTNILHILGSGATAYILANRLRDRATRANTLAGFQLAESGAVPFLTKLSERAATEGDTWLAEKLAIHAADEKRHGQIFAYGLKQMGKQVMDAEELKQQRESELEQKPSPFFANYYRNYTPEDLKAENIDWLAFMGSTYILELDASKDFVRMANALPEDEPQSHKLKQSILSVAQDETRHAAYLYEALHRRLTASKVEEIVEDWRKRKVDSMFAMVGDMISNGGNSRSLVKDGTPAKGKEKISELVKA